jgi:hypothetical protein
MFAGCAVAPRKLLPLSDRRRFLQHSCSCSVVCYLLQLRSLLLSSDHSTPAPCYSRQFCP